MEPFNQALVTNPRTYDTSTGNVLLEAANNLSDVGDAATSRSNLGLGTISTQNANSVTITGGSVTGITDLAIADGGTGAGTAAGARTNLEVYSADEVDEYLATKATAGGVRFSRNGVLVLSDNSTTGAAFDQVGNVLTYSWIGNASQQTFRQYLYIKTDSINSTGSGFEIFHTENTTELVAFFRQAGDNTGHYGYKWSNVIDGTPKHYVIKVDYTGTDPIITLAINGVDAGAGTVSLSKTGTFDDSSAYYVRVGSIAVSDTRIYDGYIKDFCIFNRALTATDIADLYRNGLAGIADADRWGKSGNQIIDISKDSEFTDVTTNWDGTFATSMTLDTTNDELDVVGSVFGSRVVLNQSRFFNVSENRNKLCRVSLNITAITGTWTIRFGVTGSPSATFSTTGQQSFEFLIPSDAANEIQVRVGTYPSTISFTDFKIELIGAIAAYPMDEGIGYQLHDISSNHYDGLLSTSGFTHLLPKTEGKVRVKAADASSAMYMLRAGDIIPTNSIVDNVLSEQCFVDLTNSAQTLDDNRIRLNPSGSDLQIQRSDGSNHQTLGTVTAPSSLSDVDVEVQYKQVIR